MTKYLKITMAKWKLVIELSLFVNIKVITAVFNNYVDVVNYLDFIINANFFLN